MKVAISFLEAVKAASPKRSTAMEDKELVAIISRNNNLGKFHRFDTDLTRTACGLILGTYGNETTVVVVARNAHLIKPEHRCKRCQAITQKGAKK